MKKCDSAELREGTPRSCTPPRRPLEPRLVNARGLRALTSQDPRLKASAVVEFYVPSVHFLWRRWLVSSQALTCDTSYSSAFARMKLEGPVWIRSASAMWNVDTEKRYVHTAPPHSPAHMCTAARPQPQPRTSYHSDLLRSHSSQTGVRKH